MSKQKQQISTPRGKGFHFQANVFKDLGIKRRLALSVKCKKNTTTKILRENKQRLSEQGKIGNDFKIKE